MGEMQLRYASDSMENTIVHIHNTLVLIGKQRVCMCIPLHYGLDTTCKSSAEEDAH